MNAADLRELFEKHGAVESADIIADRETGRSRGFGFVEMTDAEQCKKAMKELHEYESGGRPLVVNEARPREPRGQHGGAW